VPRSAPQDLPSAISSVQPTDPTSLDGDLSDDDDSQNHQWAWGRFHRRDGRNPPPGSTIIDEAHREQAANVLLAGWLTGRWGLRGMNPETSDPGMSHACHEAWAYLRAWRLKTDMARAGPVKLEPIVARKVCTRVNKLKQSIVLDKLY
jgi:hypothetical protein